MFESITDNELAKLHAKFVLPIVVDHMLRDEEPLDDVAEYAMHEMLSEMQPDTALLCIAMCAIHVSRILKPEPMAHALEIECTNLVDEYGRMWLDHEQNAFIRDQNVIDTLCYLPEDLEALRDLMETLKDDLEEDHSTAAILCDILSAQAECHRLEAEIQLTTVNLAPQSRAGLRQMTLSVGDPSKKGPLETQSEQTDNVIQFPIARAAVHQL